MLTVSQLSKSFAGRALFNDVSLQVNRGERIGLVGPNGAGKSTLFAPLLGDVSPDNGTIAIEKNLAHRTLPPEEGGGDKEEGLITRAANVQRSTSNIQRRMQQGKRGMNYEV